MRNENIKLEKAIKNGDAKAALKALVLGASVNGDLPEEGDPPLVCAVRRGKIDVIRALCKHGADVNIDPYGEGPLLPQIATAACRPDIVAVLKEFGLRQDSPSKDESDALNKFEYELSEDGSFRQAWFYGNAKWFSVTEQPDSMDDLPKTFKEAKRLWSVDKDRNINRVLKLLEPYVEAEFLLIGLNGWSHLFHGISDDDISELQAAKVHLAGIDFSESPFPLCKVEAWFRVPVHAEFLTSDAIEEWAEEKNMVLTDCISFGWNVPRSEGTADLDFTWGDRFDCECGACGPC